MYKSTIYALVFTGVKARKVKVEGVKPTNIYSLKYLLPWWQKIEEYEDPLLSIKAMLIMWITAVTGRHFSDATVLSVLFLLFLVASVFWGKQSSGVASEVWHEDLVQRLTKLPAVSTSVGLLFLVWFAYRMVLKWFDYAALTVTALAALRSFSGHASHESSMDMAWSVAQGITQAGKNKVAQLAQLIHEEVKAPPTPRGGVVGEPAEAAPKGGGEPVMPSTTSAKPPKGPSKTSNKDSKQQAPPNTSIQEQTGVRRRCYMDAKLGSTNKKAVRKHHN